MKNKIIFIVIFCCSFGSCETYKRTQFEYHFGKTKNEWINMYKTEFFFTCLEKGYQNKKIFELISQKDLLLPYEPFPEKIDTLANKLIKNMPKPIFPHCDECNEQEQLKKNYICASCLNYYASRELDSIAKKAYKEYLKTEK
nr:hypothetical protein [uncultured Flavobacterium sp.]